MGGVVYVYGNPLRVQAVSDKSFEVALKMARDKLAEEKYEGM